MPKNFIGYLFGIGFVSIVLVIVFSVTKHKDDFGPEKKSTSITTIETTKWVVTEKFFEVSFYIISLDDQKDNNHRVSVRTTDSWPRIGDVVSVKVDTYTSPDQWNNLKDNPIIWATLVKEK